MVPAVRARGAAGKSSVVAALEPRPSRWVAARLVHGAEKLLLAFVELGWSGAGVLGFGIQDWTEWLMGDVESGGEVRGRVVELVGRAEAIVEGVEAAAPDGRWALTAFSRYRLCELLEILPYVRYEGDLDGDPAVLLDEAVGLVDRIEVSIEDLSWRLALGDALRTAAADIRMVRDARDV